MINFTRLAALSALSLTVLCSTDANALKTVESFDLHKYAFKGNLARQARKNKAEMPATPVRENLGNGIFRAPEAVMPTPALSLPASETIGDIDGPDGTLWFYTGNFKYEYIQESEHYSQPVMQEYEFDIYDSRMNHVGTIRDKVRYKEGELAVPLAELAPVVTKNYFNTDDKYEVVVGLYVNTTVYKNNEYSIVYSIGGEKEDGYDKPIMVRNDMIGDVLNASTPDEEKFFITFMKDDNEEQPGNGETDPDNPDKDGYWAMLISRGLRLETYAKVDASGNLVKIWEKRLRLCDLPGDQQSSPFFITYVHDGKPYFAFSKYEDSFFNPYYEYTEESTQRENNDLIVELYSIKDNNTVELVQSANIPTKLNTEIEECSILSIRSVRSAIATTFSIPKGVIKLNLL